MEWLFDFDRNKLLTAARLADQIVAQHPDRRGPRVTLCRALIDLGLWDKALLRLRDALARFPDSAELHAMQGLLLAKQDALEEALSEVEIALALMQGDSLLQNLRFDLLVRLKRWDAAQAMLSEIARLDPFHYALTLVQISLLPAATRIPDTLNLCDAVLAESPGHTNATYFKALSLAQLGRAEEARDLIRLEHNVTICHPPVPSCWPDREAFCTALKAELKRNPTITGTQRGKSHRNAERIVEIQQPDAPAVEALIGLIRRAVDDFGIRLQSDVRVGRARPAVARLDIWATNYSSGGYEASHHHPSGWLSGVYYVSATRAPAADTYSGPLIMGALDPKVYSGEPPWGTLPVEPAPGRLVLFPSWIPHASAPGGFEGERISVAFDVIPVRSHRAV